MKAEKNNFNVKLLVPFLIVGMITLSGCKSLEKNMYHKVKKSGKIGVVFNDRASSVNFFESPHYIGSDEEDVGEGVGEEMNYENKTTINVDKDVTKNLLLKIAGSLNEGFETQIFEAATNLPMKEKTFGNRTVKTPDWSATDYDHIVKVRVASDYRSAGKDADFPYSRLFLRVHMFIREITEQGNAKIIMNRTGYKVADIESDIPTPSKNLGIRKMRDETKILEKLQDYHGLSQIENKIFAAVDNGVADFCKEERKEYRELNKE